MPDSQINLGIIGAGYWGPNLIRNFHDLPDVSIRWVCDLKPGRLEYVRQRWPEIPLTQRFEDVVEDSGVDAVVLATSVSTHYRLGLAALNSGKYVFIEKPLARTSAEAQELIETAARRRRMIFVGHTFLYHPAITVLKNYVKQGALGELCYVDFSRANLGPPASEVDVLWDLAPHDISILLHLWEQVPEVVSASGNHFRHSRLMDAAFVNLHFSDGTLAHLHVSWLSSEKVRRMFVAGSKGSALFDDLSEVKLRLLDQGIDTRIGLQDHEVKYLTYGTGQVLAPELPKVEPLRVECECFLESIRTGRPPISDGTAGLAEVRILEAAALSILKKSEPVYLK